MICEILGCPPSYIFKKFPDMTQLDYMFLKHYGIIKYVRVGEIVGLRTPEGLITG